MSSYVQNAGDKSDTIPIIDHESTSADNDNNNINDSSNHDDNENKNADYCLRTYRIIELCCCCIPVPIGVALEFGIPHKRPIPYQLLDSSGEYIVNQSYDNREMGETVSPLVMFVCALVVPFCFQLLVIFFTRNRNRNRNEDNYRNNNNTNSNYYGDEIHKTICVYLLAIGLTQSFTNVAKLYVGYLRPIFFSKCQPNEDYETCQGSHERQARVSFPSGHASLSVCGLLLISFYLERSYGVSSYSNKNNDNNNRTRIATVSTSTTNSSSARIRRTSGLPIQLVRLVSIICYAPMSLAFFIVISRVHDNFHHPADVVGGALLGGSIAAIVFGIWFPPQYKPC